MTPGGAASAVLALAASLLFPAGAADPAISVAEDRGPDVTITGTPGDDRLLLTCDPRTHRLLLNGRNLAPRPYRCDDIEELAVDGGSGDDQILLGSPAYRAPGSDTGPFGAYLSGGGGDDRLQVSDSVMPVAAGGPGRDVIRMTPLFFGLALGGSGNDTVIVDAEPGSRFGEVLGGAGDDRFRVGGGIAVHVKGGPGSDRGA